MGLVHDKYGIGRQLYFCSEIQLKEPHYGGITLKDDDKDVGRRQIQHRMTVQIKDNSNAVRHRLVSMYLWKSHSKKKKKN